MTKSRTILITGGGTGGHVFPGLALAAELVRQDPSIQIVWVGTRGRVEERAVPAAGYPIEFVDVAFLKGRGGVGKLKAMAKLPGAGLQAASLIRRHRPAAIIGVGGFASGPIGALGGAMGIPVFVLEQNARPGATNRALSKVARAVYATFEHSRNSFGSAPVKVLGNPVRASLLTGARRRQPKGKLSVLVLGGSQGARSLNEGAPLLFKALAESGLALNIVHSAGHGREDEVVAAYGAAGVEAEVTPFIDDMATAYSNTDFVLTRAGATSLCELTAVGLPAMYVPFPHAADDHQTVNAQTVVEAGGGVMVSDEELLSGGRAVRLLGPLLRHPEVLEKMARAAKNVGRPNAAKDIAADILEQLQ
jgi:UDP-N-acetylglucosamine--N-acetylmuramyl-(pentapeptide) pyrophosphoryl-undecaprenol N-acetylglucosamine transferase